MDGVITSVDRVEKSEGTAQIRAVESPDPVARVDVRGFQAQESTSEKCPRSLRMVGSLRPFGTLVLLLVSI